jgi:proteasome lid subunit RPN8/RPN11
MMALTLTQEHIDEMIAHARDDEPNEACGIIAGKDGTATGLYRMVNAQASPYRYEMAGKDVLALLRKLDGAGEEFLVIYHSHTSTEAYPSPTDVRLAAGWPDCYYVLVSLQVKAAPVVRAFRIIEAEITEEPIEIASA